MSLERVNGLSFELEHEKWITSHLSKRHGERKDALKRGHGYGNRLFAQKVWWPLMGRFTGLHPEYEVKDWRGRSYFVDFLWVLGGFRFVFEIMDYGSHGKERSKYRMDLNRVLFLQSQDCFVIAISLDEMKENPSFVLAMVRSIMAPYLAAVTDEAGTLERKFGKVERQLMRLAIRHNRIVCPAKAAKELEVHKQTVIKYCRKLVSHGKFRAIPSGIAGKIYQYEYVGSIQSPDLI
jgi:very-short-patch-repair endonuclease